MFLYLSVVLTVMPEMVIDAERLFMQMDAPCPAKVGREMMHTGHAGACSTGERVIGTPLISRSFIVPLPIAVSEPLPVAISCVASSGKVR